MRTNNNFKITFKIFLFTYFNLKAHISLIPCPFFCFCTINSDNISFSFALVYHFKSGLNPHLMKTQVTCKLITARFGDPIHNNPVSANIATYFWLNDTAISMKDVTGWLIGGSCRENSKIFQTIFFWMHCHQGDG